MGRAFFLSILLHTFVIAAIFTFLKEINLHSNTHTKRVSLNSIKIEKAESKKLKAKNQKRTQSLEPRAKSEKKAQILKTKDQSLKLKENRKAKSQKLRAQSKKRAKSKEKAQSLNHKVRSKAKNQELRAKSKKQKAKSKKFKAKSKKFKAKKRAKSFKYKVKNNKRKAKSQKSITNNQLPITNHKSQTTNYKQQSTISANIKAQIYQAINSAKVYPRLAKKMGLQGSVYTCFTLNPSGSVSNITTSGAHTILQRGARETIHRAKYAFPHLQKSLHLCINIHYLLQ